MSYAVQIGPDTYILKPLENGEYYQGYEIDQEGLIEDPNKQGEKDVQKKAEELTTKEFLKRFNNQESKEALQCESIKKNIKAYAYLIRANRYYRKGSFLLAGVLVKKGLKAECSDDDINKQLKDLSEKSEKQFKFRINHFLLEQKAFNKDEKRKAKEELVDEDLTRDGFDVNMQLYEKTSLYFACKRNNLVMARFLLENGAKIEHGPNPVFIAIEKGYNDIVKLLIEKGADLNFRSKDKSNQSILEKAVEVENFEICEYLIKEKKVNLNEIFEKSLTPLMWAVLKENLLIAQLLIENGADLKIRNCFNDTALLLAIELNKAEAILFLLSHYKNEEGIPAAKELSKKNIDLSIIRQLQMVKSLLSSRKK